LTSLELMNLPVILFSPYGTTSNRPAPVVGQAAAYWTSRNGSLSAIPDRL
jgi:hypothetical protein